MAYIKKRGEYWRAEVRRKGHKPTFRTFDTQGEAQRWARKIEAEIDTGSYVENSAAEKATLGDALKRYRREVAAKKAASDPGVWTRRPLVEERSMLSIFGEFKRGRLCSIPRPATCARAGGRFDWDCNL